MPFIFFLLGVILIEYFLYLKTCFNNTGFYVFLGLIVIDVLTGVLLSIAGKSDKSVTGKLESRHLIKGVYRKIGEILIYLLAVSISFFTSENAVAYLTLSAVIAHESLSVLENLSLLNVPIPQKLKDVLEVLNRKDKGDKEK